MNSNTGGTGYIRVAVSSGDGAFPIDAAVVYISGDNEAGDNGIIYSLRTDTSGLTEKIELPAPPKSMSQMPGSSEKPFATYNIQVLKEGYATVENISVPVFDGIISLQNINLIPEAEYAYLSPGYPDNTREIFPAPKGPEL